MTSRGLGNLARLVREKGILKPQIILLLSQDKKNPVEDRAHKSRPQRTLSSGWLDKATRIMGRLREVGMNEKGSQQNRQGVPGSSIGWPEGVSEGEPEWKRLR